MCVCVCVYVCVCVRACVHAHMHACMCVVCIIFTILDSINFFSLLGNLCRCTGYRPILDGYRTFCCKGNSDKCACSKDEHSGTIEVRVTKQMHTVFIFCLFCTYRDLVLYLIQLSFSH